jgi:hypothetical protein
MNTGETEEMQRHRELAKAGHLSLEAIRVQLEVRFVVLGWK